MKRKLNTELRFGNLYPSPDEYEYLEHEEFEVVKNGVKTIIACKFNKGFLVTFSFISKPISKSKEKKEAKLKKPKERFIKTRG